ncbi:hypothetical protein [Mesorhizobium sp. CN2-181]|uniref:hypothetical protein n=1 Tax=Mesorhizobium yinganensis TaxID=3157707 RepID=UPI0032B7D91E
MDWNAAIDKNREALKRILAMLVGMAGLAAGIGLAAGGVGAGGPDAGDLGAGDLGAGGQFTLFPRKGAAASRQVLAEKSKLSPALNPALTLPRHLHRAILKLLRPAEAAARRLIVVAARGLVLPPPSPRKPKPKKLGRRKFRRIGRQPEDRRVPALPLFDPLPPWNRRPSRPAPCGVPRISIAGFGEPVPVAAPPSRNDPVDATRLALRLQTLAATLDDLPRQAKRFARWQARRDAASAQDKKTRDAMTAGDGDPDAMSEHDKMLAAIGARRRMRKAATARSGDPPRPGRARRIWPLKPGRPPGWRPKPTHDVHEVLDVVHGLACWVLQSPDTS